MRGVGLGVIRPDKKIKVVHLSNHEISLKVHSRNQMIFLANRGYDVSIICNPGDFFTTDMTTPDGIFVKAIPFPSKIAPFQDALTFYRLWRYMRQKRFHIVHTHTIKPGLLGRLAAWLAGVPVLMHTVHGFYFHDLMPARTIKLYSTVERIGAICSDLILSQNREDINRAINMKICHPAKIKYLGNGIDIDRFHPRRITAELVKSKRDELGIQPNRKIVCQIARLVDHKGYEDFLESAKILKAKNFPATFLAIGQRHYKKGAIDLCRMIKDMNLEGYVRFLGERDDIPDLMAVVDLIVLASWGVEGIPRVIMECAAMGKAAVVTNIRGNREAVLHGKTGYLVPPRDPKSLAEAIETFLKSPENSRKMGLFARKRAKEIFDERNYFEKTDQFYRQLLRRKAIQTDTLKPIRRCLTNH
jgi:glycosyltransferase involved in cell wall biosynthesis